MTVLARTIVTLLTYQQATDMVDFDNRVSTLFAVIFVLVYFQIMWIDDMKKDMEEELMENRRRTVLILNLQDKTLTQGTTNSKNIIQMAKIQTKIIKRVNDNTKVLREHITNHDY